MNRISLRRAHQLLAGCSKVAVDNVVCRPSVEPLTGDIDNQFLLLSWEISGVGFSVIFAEGENRTVEVRGPELLLTDIDGDVSTVTMLATRPAVEALAQLVG